VLVGLIVLTAVLLWVTLRRWVTGPLDRLGSEVAVVTGGELGHAVTVSGPSEISVLGREVDSMRERIVEEYASALEARALTQDALAVVEEQKADLERSNTELEQFAYVASHDLQEPLRKVASFCQLLEKRYGDQLDERGHQYIEFAVDGAKRMQALINDLLAFSRVGRLSEGFVDVDLDAVLDSVLRNLEVLVEETGATVTHDPLPTVPGEPALLAALLQNLVGNGIKFHGAEPPRVHLGATREGDVWELSCADNGIGIDPKYADKIFVIFQRLHGRDEYSGTGIGLALSRKIVEHHGGRIWLDPEVAAAGDRGTTFRFTVPVEHSARPSLEAVADNDPRPVPVGPTPASTPGGAP
jgi:light-regulated signal transduction histidine kinase (bacteriophytochrome)